MVDIKQRDEKPPEGSVPVRLMKPGFSFDVDLFDEDNNLILKEHTPISEGMLNHLTSSGVEFIYFDPTKRINQADGKILKPIISEELKNETLNHTKSILEEMRDTFTRNPGAGIARSTIEKSRDLVSKIIIQTESSEDGVFDAVTKLKDMDEYYYHHSMNVAIMASILGSRLDFKPDLKAAMGVGGLFHDIGFSSVSKEILYNAQHSDEEYDILKGHTHVGYKFVENNRNLHDIEKRILLLHHEQADGEGYPFGFDMDHYQNNVPREVRLLGLVDFFILLTNPKPGEIALSPRNAMRFMLNKIYAPYKTVFSFLHPDLRDFIRAIGLIANRGEYFMMPGDLVRISTGDIGVIEEMNRLYPLNPKIRIIKNSKMEALKRPIVIDMLKTYQDYVSNIYEKNNAGKFSINNYNAAGS